eukprot:TRINITY_DN314_c0_g3_i1.p1 TRINITY_DN314_c0_g3~~TRINITY_DN314_c0_g3_i1.p1  ORF type:complete len:1021 (-),score=232.26 TRINITY_DN314_c0_g3_i1:999-4028(-)
MALSSTGFSPPHPNNQFSHSIVSPSMNNGRISPPLAEDLSHQKNLRDKQLSRRNCIIKEFVDTENTYAKTLENGSKQFITSIRDRKFLTEEQILFIFGNILEIQEFSASLCKKLIAARKNDEASSVGEVFGSLFQANFNKIYHQYIQGFYPALKLAEQQELINRGLNNLTYNNHHLNNFISLPLDRLSRYSVLIRDLLKCTPSDHNDYKEIESSFQTISTLISHQEEIKQAYQNLERLESITNSFREVDRGCLDLVGPARSLIAEGRFLSETQKKLHLFVFNDIIICAEKKKEKHSLLWRVRIIDCRFEETNEGETTFLIVEIRRITTYPFVVEIVHSITALANSSCTAEFWRETFKKAFSEFWNRNNSRSLLLQHSKEMARHMMENLLTKNDWRKLQSVMLKEDLRKGEVLFHKQHTMSRVYWLGSGTLSFYLHMGKDVLHLSTLSKGQFFGQVEFVIKRGYLGVAFSAVAAEDSVVLSVDREDLAHILQEDEAFAERFYRLLCYDIAHLFIASPIQNALERIKQRKARRASGSNGCCSASPSSSSSIVSCSPPWSPTSSPILSPSSASSSNPNSNSSSSLLFSSSSPSSSFNSSLSHSPTSPSPSIFLSTSPLMPALYSIPNKHQSADTTPAINSQGISNVSEKVKRNLGLKDDDEIVRQYPAQLKPPKGPEGRVYVSKDSVYFYARAFGLKSKVILPDADILGVAFRADNILTLLVRGKKDPVEFSLKSPQFMAEALDLLKHRISERTQHSQPQFSRQNPFLSTSTNNAFTMSPDHPLPILLSPGITRNFAASTPALSRPSRNVLSSSTGCLPIPLVSTTTAPAQRFHTPHDTLGLESSGANFRMSPPNLKSTPALPKKTHKLNASDWDELVACASTLQFKEGNSILKQGEASQRLYQVLHGSCRVEFTPPGKDVPEVIGYVHENDVFGDLSFILGGVAMASVVAQEESVRVMFFERSKLDVVLKLNHRLSAGFYRYLAKKVMRRFAKVSDRALSATFSSSSPRRF